MQREAIVARHYIGDILAGLVPSDASYDPIYEIVAAHGGCALTQLPEANVIAMAAALRRFRNPAYEERKRIASEGL